MLVLPPFGQLSGVWGKATPTPTLHCTTGCHVDRSLVQAVWGKSAQPVDRRYYTIIAESRNVERALRVNRPPWRRSDGFNLSAPGCSSARSRSRASPLLKHWLLTTALGTRYVRSPDRADALHYCERAPDQPLCRPAGSRGDVCGCGARRTAGDLYAAGYQAESANADT